MHVLVPTPRTFAVLVLGIKAGLAQAEGPAHRRTANANVGAASNCIRNNAGLLIVHAFVRANGTAGVVQHFSEFPTVSPEYDVRGCDGWNSRLGGRDPGKPVSHRVVLSFCVQTEFCIEHVYLKKRTFYCARPRSHTQNICCPCARHHGRPCTGRGTCAPTHSEREHRSGKQLHTQQCGTFDCARASPGKWHSGRCPEFF